MSRCLVIALLVMLLLSQARVTAEPATGRFERLNNRHGLSQMTVYAILQDRLGFMWFGTADGLNRFDGERFEIFKHQPGDPGSLSSGAVTSLLEDHDGDLWIGTHNGLNRYDPRSGEITRFRLDPRQREESDPSNNEIWALLEDREGDLWIGTWGGGLYRFDPATETFESFRHDPVDPHSLPGNFVPALTLGPRGDLWIGTWDGGLGRFDRATGRFESHGRDLGPHGPGYDSVRALRFDRAGQLWIGTLGSGLLRFDPKSGEFESFRYDPTDPCSLGDDYVFDILEDSTGDLWAGTLGGGLQHVAGSGPAGSGPAGSGPDDGEDICFSRYRHDSSDPASLAHDFVRAIYEDRAGSLWIGTSGGGLSRRDRCRPQFKTHRHDATDPTSLAHDVVRALHEDQTGDLWIGTEGGGLDHYDRATGSFTHHRHDPADPSSLGHDRVNAIWEDRQGGLWLATFSGLDHFNRDSGRFTHYRHDSADPQSLTHDAIYTLAGGRAEYLWIGTLGGGLDRFDPRSKSFVHHRHDPADPRSLSDDFIRVILEDREGRVWVGTARGGLDVLEDRNASANGGGGFTHYRHSTEDPTSLSHNHVMSLLQDRAGNLWVGTGGGGLNRLDSPSGRFERFTEADGLPNNFVYAILEDEHGRLWMSTNRGLASFDPATSTWAAYDSGDGLQDDEFIIGAARRGSDGTLYFGGVNGFNAFRPATFRASHRPPPVALTGFRIFERPVRRGPPAPYLEEIALEPGENFFTFEFAALNFIRADKNRYLYRLEGFDEDWVPAGSRQRASYTKVPPGHYVFRVRGSNNEGLWSESDAAVRIVVRPPPWQTPWAYASYALAGVALLTGFLRRQRNQVEHQRNQFERQRVINQRLREADQVKDRLIGELEDKNAELERFTYTVSHDLKSPLVTILGFLGFARHALIAGKTERAVEDLNHIEEAAKKMRRLLEELLELSRIGRVIQPAQDLQPAELIAEARTQLAGQLKERDAVLEVADHLPAVRGDRVRLVEVFQNLIDNAVKFTPPEETPRVEVGVRPGCISTNGDGSAAAETVFYVRDHGCGIDPDYREKIFSLFERLDPEVEGTGIGLALVKRIVELHGGQIWVESPEHGRGSTFCFTLPRGAVGER